MKIIAVKSIGKGNKKNQSILHFEKKNKMDWRELIKYEQISFLLCEQ